jgi:hypothetical protein
MDNAEQSLSSTRSAVSSQKHDIDQLYNELYRLRQEQQQMSENLRYMQTLDRNALAVVFRLHDFVDWHNKKLCGIRFVATSNTIQLDSEQGYPIPEECVPPVILTEEELEILKSFMDSLSPEPESSTS